MRIPNQRAITMTSLLFTAGCAAAVVDPAGPNAERDAARTEAIAALAAPGQDVGSARLVAPDNCYWYEHTGPVETTLLPLKTVDGQPICLQSGT